jgi:hypothetical protein
MPAVRRFKLATKPLTVGYHNSSRPSDFRRPFSCPKDNTFDVRPACELVVGYCRGAVADRVHSPLCPTHPPEPAWQHHCLAENWSRTAAGSFVLSLAWEACVEAEEVGASGGSVLPWLLPNCLLPLTPATWQISFASKRPPAGQGAYVLFYI